MGLMPQSDITVYLTRGRMGLTLQSDVTLCALPGEGWVSCCSLTSIYVFYQGKDGSHAAV